MSLFTGKHFENFKNDPRVKESLIVKNRKFAIFHRDDIIKNYINIDKDFFINCLTNYTCKKEISIHYVFNSLTNAFQNPNYDIVIIVEITNGYDKISLQKNLSIIAFMVTEKGACKYHSNAVVLNLLCCQGPVSASVLLAGYLYMIKSSNYKQMAILGLAGGFTNISGLCLYSKFGFKANISLQKKCFKRHDLAMSVYMTQYQSNDDILNVLAKYPTKNGKKTRNYENKRNPLCDQFNPLKTNPENLFVPTQGMDDEKLIRYSRRTHQKVHPLYRIQRDMAVNRQSRHNKKTKKKNSYTKDYFLKNTAAYNSYKKKYISDANTICNNADTKKKKSINFLPANKNTRKNKVKKCNV